MYPTSRNGKNSVKQSEGQLQPDLPTHRNKASFALFQHPERVTNDCKLIQYNLEITDLITGKTEFWKGPYKNEQCLSYPISGLFVKFLIDKYGIDKLRRVYQYPDITEGFKTIYNVELPVIVTEWGNYILRNIE